MIIKSKSAQETIQIAKKLASFLHGGEIILLNGDLGAGKTTFAKAILSSLGVKDNVTSPTFSILKTYQGKFTFHHFDTYRITTEEAIEAGFDEVLSDKNSVKLIEWSENISELIPKHAIVVNIKKIDEQTRSYEIIR